MKQSLLHDIFEFEFKMFKSKTDSIDGIDFARSIVKYAEPSLRAKFLARINNMQSFEAIKISQTAYIGFHLYMSCNFDSLSSVLS